MPLVEELCVLAELTLWSCLQSDWLPVLLRVFMFCVGLLIVRLCFIGDIVFIY